MELWNTLPPIVKALVPVVTLLTIGLGAGFLSDFVGDSGLVVRLKQYTLRQHIVAATGSICFGIVVWFFVSYLFDTFLVPILTKV